MTRPRALAVQVENIPDVLTRERRWVTWRYVWSEREGRAGRWIKFPSGKTNDPSTWTSLRDALYVYRAREADGIGFCLGGDYAGIDFDHCRNESGVLSSDAIAAISRVPCYLEVSPSGTGMKAIGRADRMGGEINFGVTPAAFTPWSSARFFTVTGHARGTGQATEDISDLIREWFRPTTGFTGSRPSFIRDGDTRGTEHIERLTDEQVIDRIVATPQADKFIALVRGDLSEYGGDHSRADQALCSILAYWCQGDLEQVDRLFRQSGLMRPKWNTASYRRATLAKAVQS